MIRALWGLLLCLCALPSAARAERALVLAPRAERGLSESERTQLMQALTSAVQAEGLDVVEEVGATDAPCADAACAEARLTAAGVEHSVELTAWRGSEGAISGVSVLITLVTGERFGEGAELAAGGDLSAAVREATRGVYVRLARGPGPWLELEGTPTGATITIDGEAAGVLPRRVKVSGGLHRVVVASPGHESLEQMVTVPRNLDAAKRVVVELRPLPEAAATQDALDRASPWNYVIAGAAVVGGVVLGLGPLRTAIEDGECGRERAGRCTGVVEMNDGEAVKLIGAGVWIAGGIAFAIWAPLRIDASENAVMARWTGRF